MPGDPLSRYPAIHTSDVEEFEHRLSDVYGASGFDLEDSSALKVRANFVELNDCALGFATCGTSVAVRFQESDFARLQVSLRGQGLTRSGERSALVGQGRPVLTSAGRPATLAYGVGFEQLFLRVKSAALARKLAALLGGPVRQELSFELADFASPEMMLGLQRLLDMLVRQLDDHNGRLSPLALREVEQALVVQLLFTGRHDWSALLLEEPRDLAPAPVRRAEAFIEANWNHPIGIEALAEVAGVSARTLFRAFEKSRGCSPMAFVKKIRLERARDFLSRPEGTTSVTGIAFACGFLNPGHFASDYRKTFGELPSQTLNRSKFRL